ncbi:MAG: hypothetical protein ACRBFS_22950 [Aureispira sp.]
MRRKHIGFFPPSDTGDVVAPTTQFYLKPPVFESTGDINSLQVDDVIMPNIPEWRNDYSKMIQFSTMEYRWYRDGVLISTDRYLHINNADANAVISYTVFAEDVANNQLTNITPVVVGTVGNAKDLILEPTFADSRGFANVFSGAQTHNKLNKSFDETTVNEHIYQTWSLNGNHTKQAESDGLSFTRHADNYLAGKFATRLRQIKPQHDQQSMSYYGLIAIRYKNTGSAQSFYRNRNDNLGDRFWINATSEHVFIPIGYGIKAKRDYWSVVEYNIETTNNGGNNALVNYRFRYWSEDQSLNHYDVDSVIAGGTVVRDRPRSEYWDDSVLDLLRFGLHEGLSGAFPVDVYNNTDFIAEVVSSDPTNGYRAVETAVGSGVFIDPHQAQKDANMRAAVKDVLNVINA